MCPFLVSIDRVLISVMTDVETEWAPSLLVHGRQPSFVSDVLPLGSFADQSHRGGIQ